jgi:hypothetical protein
VLIIERPFSKVIHKSKNAQEMISKLLFLISFIALLFKEQKKKKRVVRVELEVKTASRQHSSSNIAVILIHPFITILHAVPSFRSLES